MLTIATRGSQLALWQANWIRNQILQKHPDLDVQLLPIKTKGDQILDHPLAKIGGKGLFVKELEQAMLEGKADLAVHSMKDVPGVLPEGLEISVITKRESPTDALIAPGHASLAALPQGAVIGTSSLRRLAQLKYHRPDLQFETLRGNVETRLKKAHTSQYDAIVLATAGLQRMGLQENITQELPMDLMLPAIAQGAVGIETRVNDAKTLSLLEHLHDAETTDCVVAERAVLTTLEGNCQIPIAGYATIDGDQLTLTGRVADPEGSKLLEHRQTGARKDAFFIGEKVAKWLLDNGGNEILSTLSA